VSKCALEQDIGVQINGTPVQSTKTGVDLLPPRAPVLASWGRAEALCLENCKTCFINAIWKGLACSA